MVWWLLPPSVWSGAGSAWGGYPPPPNAGVRVFLRWSPPAFLGLLWVFGIPIPMVIMMMMGTMITIIIINSNILMFLWMVVGCLLPTCLVTIIALLIRRATIFATVVALGAIAIRLQQANCHWDRACQGTRSWRPVPCLRPSCRSQSSFFGKCAQSQGSGVFGTCSS